MYLDERLRKIQEGEEEATGERGKGLD